MSDQSSNSLSPFTVTKKSAKMPIYTYDCEINTDKHLYPHSIVWTPIPLLTWLFPIIGHMGICMTNGIIRDFAGPYCVSEDHMAFGNPTKYWQLDLDKVPSMNQKDAWDRGVHDASEVYKGRIHNLICDNCHSHVAMALRNMDYGGTKWNMVNVWFQFTIHSKYVSCLGFIKSWLPFFVIITIIIVLAVVFSTISK